jgi:hypothetical protein
MEVFALDPQCPAGTGDAGREVGPRPGDQSQLTDRSALSEHHDPVLPVAVRADDLDLSLDDDVQVIGRAAGAEENFARLQRLLVAVLRELGELRRVQPSDAGGGRRDVVR